MFPFRHFKEKEHLPFHARMIRLVVITLIVWGFIGIGLHIVRNKSIYTQSGKIGIPALEVTKTVIIRDKPFKVESFDYSEYEYSEDVVYIRLKESKE
jgi:hypothetical protein